MKTRITVLAVAAAALFGGAGSAAVTSEPTLSISPQTSALSTAGSTVLHFEDSGQAPVSTIEVYAPAEYGVDLTQPPGTAIGTIEAQVRTAAGATLHRDGLIKVADPATLAAATAACTPGKLVHDAVWTFGLNGSGLPAEHIPIFVDRDPAGAGPGQPAAVLHICLAPPSVSEARLVQATLTVNDVFTNPSARGDYVWAAVFTAQGALGQPPPTPTASETIVRLPAHLTLTKKVIRGTRRRSYVRLAGFLTENLGGVSGARVEIMAGRTARTLKRLVFVTTFTHGRFSLVAPLRRATLFQAHASVPVRTAPLGRCASLSLRLDAVCTSVAIASLNADSRAVRAAPKARPARVRP